METASRERLIIGSAPSCEPQANRGVKGDKGNSLIAMGKVSFQNHLCLPMTHVEV